MLPADYLLGTPNKKLIQSNAKVLQKKLMLQVIVFKHKKTMDFTVDLPFGHLWLSECGLSMSTASIVLKFGFVGPLPVLPTIYVIIMATHLQSEDYCYTKTS